MMSSINWGLEISDGVLRALKKIPKRDAVAILGAVKLLPQNPYLGDIQKMKGEQQVWRKRVGSYRIFYEIFNEKKCVFVFRVERRTSSTY